MIFLTRISGAEAAAGSWDGEDGPSLDSVDLEPGTWHLVVEDLSGEPVVPAADRFYQFTVELGS